MADRAKRKRLRKLGQRFRQQEKRAQERGDKDGVKRAQRMLKRVKVALATGSIEARSEGDE